MKKTLTFGLFYDLFITAHTHMKIRTSINQIFYGNPDGQGPKFVSQAQCSKIRKDGIMPGSQLSKDYLSEQLTVDERAAYLKGLNLYGFNTGKDILNLLGEFAIPDSLSQEISSEPDIHVALAKLLYYLVAIPPQAEELLFSGQKSSDSVVYAGFSENVYDFFEEIFRANPEDLCVDMAFHSGTDFFFREEDIAFFQKLLEKGYRIRVLLNSRENLAPVLTHMTQPGRIYPSFEEICSLWKEKSLGSNGQLVVRTTKIPLMHKVYLCHNSHGFEMGLVRFYLYGSFTPMNEIGHVYTKNSVEHVKLQEEFQYLWDTGTPVGDASASMASGTKSISVPFNTSGDLSVLTLKGLLKDTVLRAEKGDPQAMFDAGCMYFHNFNDSSEEEMEQNYGQAIRWFEAARKSDHPVSKQALYMIARMHYYGEIPAEEQSFEQAFHLREELHGIQPSTLMALNILDMKKAGLGTEFVYSDIQSFIQENMDLFDDAGLHSAAAFLITYGDYKKAIELLERITSIVPEAEYKLGMLYLQGLHKNPPEPDPRIAMHHLSMAADCGMEKAYFELGKLYFHGAYGFHKNHYKAREFLKKAADKGSTAGQYIYAWLCRHGIGGNRNLAEARTYFELGANSGHYHCMTELAQIYLHKEYRDYEKAFFWARKAVESGDLYSEVILGNLYFTGRGCRRDLDMAMIHYKKALKYGFFDAEMMMRRIEELKKSQS